MAEIIKPREYKTHTEFELTFYNRETGEVHYGFPLTNGQIAPCKQGLEPSTYEPCSEEECTWWNNYQKAKSDPELFSKVEKHTWGWHESAVAICECGKRISLNHDAEECLFCGRLHNLFGQELLPREYWEEDDNTEDEWW